MHRPRLIVGFILDRTPACHFYTVGKKDLAPMVVSRPPAHKFRSFAMAIPFLSG